ncbi:MAG TPA: hypothetical protein VFY84_13940 [Jiangellales bacterium]|nr:hypothetical protein [Jiangellales bacterium]
MGFDLAVAREFKRRGLTPEQAFTQGRSTTSRPVMHGGAVVPRFSELKVPPQVIHSYLGAKWTDDEALAWARRYVPAEVAKLWLALGLTPAEGAALTLAGRNPAKVMREWWRAGIPYDEVADWLGAGLTAAEAAEQRARGITVEHAATLRGLRRGDGTKPD